MLEWYFNLQLKRHVAMAFLNSKFVVMVFSNSSSFQRMASWRVKGYLSEPQQSYFAGRFTVVCNVLQCSRWGHEAMLTPYQPQLTQHARNGSKRVCSQRIQTVLDIRSFSARSCIRVRWHFSLNHTLVHSLSTWQCNSICPSRPAQTFWCPGAKQKMEATVHHKNTW